MKAIKLKKQIQKYKQKIQNIIPHNRFAFYMNLMNINWNNNWQNDKDC